MWMAGTTPGHDVESAVFHYKGQWVTKPFSMIRIRCVHSQIEKISLNFFFTCAVALVI
jgi:hypothetical protein